MSSTPLRDEGLRAHYDGLKALVGANITLPPLAKLTATLAEDGKRVGDVAFKGEFGDNCVVFTRAGGELGAQLTVVGQGGDKPTDTCIYVGNLASSSSVKIRGARNVVAIGARRSGTFEVSIAANDGSTVVIGDGTTTRGLTLACRSASVSIGRNCMFASEVSIHCVDVHSLIAIEGKTARQIKRAHACAIGEKVWIGRNSKLMTGAKVGHGSVIGAHSVLAGEIPETSTAAGNPCRTIRKGVTWSRSREKIDGTTRKYLTETLGCTEIIDHPEAQTIESESK